MKKSTKIGLGVASTILVVLLLFVFNYNFEKKIKILDCEETYQDEKPRPGFIGYSKSNAESSVAICLCEKYMKTKDSIYKKEILKLYNEPFGGMRLIIDDPKNIDSICKYRKEVFPKMFEL